MPIKTLDDFALDGKRLLIRQDLNVPVKDGEVTSDARILASLPTLEKALDQGAKVMVMSHLGRPEEGKFDAGFSLAPVARRMQSILNKPVRLVSDYLDKMPEQQQGEIILLENVRFNPGEKKNDQALAERYAALCDLYVMDAFGTAHRAQASTHGAGVYAPDACAGPLLVAELNALGKAMSDPKRPVVAVVGGSKVSTKLSVLDSLSSVVDQLIVGGGIANTFIAADGHDVGQSLYEPDLIDEAKRLMQKAADKGATIPIPSDVVCGKAFAADTPATTKSVKDVQNSDFIFDIGPDTAHYYADILSAAGTIIWNGPVGVFEFDQFGGGTQAVAQAIAKASGFSVAGGGDTLAAVDKYDIADDVSYISTGGGAFLEFLEGKKLPAVEMLESRYDS